MTMREEFDFKKCERCPIARHMIAEAEDYRVEAETIGKIAISDTTDRIIAPALKELGLGDDPGMETQDIAKTVRVHAAETIDDIQKDIDNIVHETSHLVGSCDGPLKMRSSRDQQTVTATVCMSKLMPLGTSCEDAHIERS